MAATSVSRRQFLALGAGALVSRPAGALPSFSVRTLTRGPKHHFFGYYGIPPWNASSTRMVCLETDFHDRLPQADEPAIVGLVDPDSGAFTRVSETRAWNLQQGAMLNWSPLHPDRELIFNDRRHGEVVTAILDVRTGEKRHLLRAVSGVGHRGRLALSLTYGRLTRLRKVVGYPGTIDPYPDDPHPAQDGVFVLDLRTGAAKLVVSIAAVFERLRQRHPELEDRHLWLDHTCWNRSDTRFFFLARTFLPDPRPKPDGTRGHRLESAMFTANADGSGLREVVPFGKGVSHFEWRNDRQILATYRFHPDRVNHVLFTDGRQDHAIVGEDVLLDDGHASFAPDGQWLVTDRNHKDTIEKSLTIYNVRTKQALDLGRFPMKERKFLGGDTRCDLHPRWSRRGDAICFDALETTGWTRQLHVAERAWTRPSARR